MEERIKRIIGKIIDLKEFADREINDKYFAGQAVGLNFVLGLIYDEFPELAESEDERIRKWLIDEIKSIYDFESPHLNPMVEKALAYLEKQKEQKPTAEEVLIKAGLKPFKDGNQWCVLAGDNIQEGVCGFGDTIEDALYDFLISVLDLQKEQKPYQEVLSDSENRMLDYHASLVRGEERKPFAHENDFVSKSKGYIENAAHNYAMNFGDKESELYIEIFDAYKAGAYYAELRQKPAEWSEENENAIETAISYLNDGYGFISSVDEMKFRTALAKRLKSLRPQPH